MKRFLKKSNNDSNHDSYSQTESMYTERGRIKVPNQPFANFSKTQSPITYMSASNLRLAEANIRL